MRAELRPGDVADRVERADRAVGRGGVQRCKRGPARQVSVVTQVERVTERRHALCPSGAKSSARIDSSWCLSSSTLVLASSAYL